jgi:hypothetical protein
MSSVCAATVPLPARHHTTITEMNSFTAERNGLYADENTA